MPSPEEVARFLDAVNNLKHRVILTACYATGLRVSEAVSLKATAIDSKRMVVRVDEGKGRKCYVKHFCPYVFAEFMLRWFRNSPAIKPFP